MTIRSTLLIFFLLMSLVPATILTALAFFQARQAVKIEIMQNLEEEASALMEQIDRMLFERLENVHTWSHLEIMQEIRVGDVDKRLSQFLLHLKKHYGEVYKTLYCVNAKGTVIAASDPNLVGRTPSGQPAWLTADLPSGEAYLEPLLLDTPNEAASLPIRAPVDDVFQAGELGNLQVLFDWTEIFRLLDKSGQNHIANDSESLALLFDRTGRIIAASAPLRRQGLLLSDQLASWGVRADQEPVMEDTGNALGVGKVLVGSAQSKGYQHFPGFGWSVLVVHPIAVAFAPIERMATAFILLLALTSVTAIGVSLLVAGRIARPIIQLTEFTRHFMHSQQLVDPPQSGQWEVGELTTTFTRMIHDLEKSKENLVRAAKLAVVGEMAAVMAHEVRTPLGILRSSAQMLQRESSLTAEGREMLSFLLSETDRLNNLISALLDCARPRPPRFRPCHLQAIIQRVTDLLLPQAQRKNIALTCEFNAATDHLSCDEEQMVQVFLNLLINPLQILPSGGQVIVRTQSSGNGLIVYIDDNGPGIDEAHRQHVFDPFFTLREGGIGLGLTVVQQIVRAHGGTIVAEASPMSGARFCISFPESLRTHAKAGQS